MNTVRVGSRGSRLALAQVQEIFALLQKKGVALNYTSKVFKTGGDKDKKTSLTVNPADDFFTDALDRALLRHTIDIAVHSAKDLPKTLRDGLSVFALTQPLDATDAFVGEVSIFKLKKGAKVGTSSALRKKEIENLNPHIKTVDIRGTIDERLSLVDKGKLDGVIVASCALKRLNLSHRIKDILPYEATALQGQLAVVGREDDVKLKEAFVCIDARTKFGRVTLVGAGPGDPELITLKGIRALENADIVFYDYLIDTQLLQYAQKAEKIYVGKRKGNKALAQSELSKMLCVKAREGKNVVRLKGGDPLIFGRGADEIDYLRAYHIDVDIIPGISSATGIPSVLGIPLTARGVASSVAFVSGHGEDETTHRPKPVTIPQTDTIVFLMGLTKLNAITRSLKKSGWKNEAPVLVISKGTRSDEKIVYGNIKTIEKRVLKEKLEPPALIIAGEVVKFWSKKIKVKKGTLYVGTNPGKYENFGRLVHLPMIEITPVFPAKEEIKILTDDLKNYDIIILTSRFAVSCFMKILASARYPLSDLSSVDIAVVGRDTAQALKTFGLKPKVISAPETSEGLLGALLKEYTLKGKRILFPRSALPNPFLKDELIKRGAYVKELTVYENTKPAKRDISFENIKQVIFTSPSTVENFLADYGMIPEGWHILSRGPHTQKALEKAGYKSEVLVL